MPEQCKRFHSGHRRGTTISNVIAVIVCVGISFVLVLYMMPRRHGSGQLSRDATQIRGIHQSWLLYAREFDGMMPTPGLVDRLPFNGQEEPGRGAEDITQNTTANLHSICLMQNFYSPSLCVGPTEPNPKVTVFDSNDYDYELYKPAQSMYWDPAFKADLQTGSNVSYASMPLHGKARLTQWKASLDAKWPIIGNRGPRDGVHDPSSYTNKIHPPHDQWSGNICFNDNHIEFFTGLSAKPPVPGSSLLAQDVFRYDGEDDVGGILTFVKAMTPEGPVIQHD